MTYAPKTFRQRSAVTAALLNLAALLVEALAGWLPAIADLVPPPWGAVVLAAVVTVQQLLAGWIVHWRGATSFRAPNDR